MRALGASSIVALLLLGCARPSIVISQAPSDPTQERLAILGRAYREFNVANRRPPRSMIELSSLLKQHGIDDTVLQSTRDGQPLLIRWSLDVLHGKPHQPPPVLAYEQRGAKGSRFVLTAMGNVQSLDEKDFQSATSSTNHGRAI